MNFKDQIEHLKTFFTPSVKNVILLIRWLITAVFTGLLVGAVGTLFYYAMSFVTDGKGCQNREIRNRKNFRHSAKMSGQHGSCQR